MFITIKNSNFTNWNVDYGIIIYIRSSSDVIISFYVCNFVSNTISSNLIDIWYLVPYIFDPDNYPRHVVMFNKSLFSHTDNCDCDKMPDVPLLSFTIFSGCLNFTLHVNFNNVMFYENKQTLLKVETGTTCLSQYHAFIPFDFHYRILCCRRQHSTNPSIAELWTNTL